MHAPEPKWQRAAVWAVALGLVAMVAFSVATALAVSSGRRTVEANVRRLSLLQRLADRLTVEPSSIGDIDALFTELAAHESADVVTRGAELHARLEAHRQAPSAETLQQVRAAIGPTVVALRSTTSSVSERLGTQIDHLYWVVGFLVLLGAATLWVFARERRASAALAESSRRRIELAEQEHAQRLQLVQALSASTAHEINNPLTAVLLALQYVEGHETQLTPRTGEAIRSALDGTLRIRDIVAALRKNTADAKQGVVELGTALESTLKLLEFKVADRAALQVKLDERRPVRGSYVALGQVVTNLVVNAVEAFAERPREQNVVTVATRAVDAQWAELTVSDNGPGFDPATRAKLSQPFFTTKATGSGLGLFVCKRIVESVGGTLELASAGGGGARVVVRLRFP